MVNVLITGGAGFLGVPTALALTQRGHVVSTLDMQTNDRLEAAGVTQHIGSVLDQDILAVAMGQAQPDTIIHAAAVVGVAASVNAIERSVEVNVRGSVALFEAALQAGVSRFIDISSEETYGDFTADPIGEDAWALPFTPYGITKYAVERLGNYYADQRGLAYVALRFSWVYGPDFPRARIPQNWIDAALAGTTSVEPHGSEQLIDFTYIDDVVAGLVKAVEAGSLAHRAYNMASGTKTSFAQVAQILKQECPGWDLQMGDGLLEVLPGMRSARKGALDIERARTEVGYQPGVSMEEGIHRTLQWCKQHRSN
ncbi:MAG: NAD-dependent epimerase/dehydratase family protein [Propionibacteriaceae bacterium]|nr:NAD-dependent epimerase/dehydratase family protein [Propionibacteriaceae bacterium]